MTVATAAGETPTSAPPERDRPHVPAGPGWTPRRWIGLGALAALGWAVARAGVGDGIVNTRGFGAFGRFWAGAADPELGVEFLTLTLDAAAVTLAYAVLGTVLSLVLAAGGALALSELVAGNHPLARAARVAVAVPRAVHELVVALLLIQILGFDPLVAVLAIGIPFGAVSAKVFADAIDEADPRPYRALRQGGARRLPALWYGVLPSISGDLVSYSFYRFECGIRSAAVLGVIGAGGLGFQLDLSFETLRYGEMWTLIAALVVLSGLADGWSAWLRRDRNGARRRRSLVALGLLVPLSWWWVALDPSTLWSARSRELAVDLADRLVPVRLGPGGWAELAAATVDTVAMSILALTLAAGGGLAAALMAARPTGRTARTGPVGRLARAAVRAALLLFRAVPAPIWAFLLVLILFPGPWPGAAALGLYNLGVLGRLFAEAVEERDSGPTEAVTLLGAGPLARLTYAILPTAGPRLAAIALYRWEVIVRETVLVGVVGAGGLGQLLRDHLAARDFAAIGSVVLAVAALAVITDLLSSRIRRHLR